MGWETFKEKAKNLSSGFYFKKQFRKIGEKEQTQYQVWEKPKVEGPGFIGDYKVMVINYPDDFKNGSPWERFFLILKTGVKRRNANKQAEVFDNYQKKQAALKAANDKKVLDDSRAFFRQERRAFAGMADEHGLSRSALKSQLTHLNEDEAKKELAGIE